MTGLNLFLGAYSVQQTSLMQNSQEDLLPNVNLIKEQPAATPYLYYPLLRDGDGLKPHALHIIIKRRRLA